MVMSLKKRCKVCGVFLTRKNQLVGICNQCRNERKSSIGFSFDDTRSMGNILSISLEKYSQMENKVKN